VALCLLVVQGRLPRPDFILCADTGREARSTWDYLDTHTRSLLAMVGLHVDVVPHSLAAVDLYARDGQTLLPAYTATGALRTFCSTEWKARVMQRWLRTQGVRGATSWVGFTLDERHRVTGHQDPPWYRSYPLIDLMLTRSDCERLLLDAGLPLPPKSSCFCCPFRTNVEWRHIRDLYPDQWEEAIALDEEIRAADDRDGLYLHRSRVPLARADIDTPERTQTEKQCGLGYCFL